MGGGNGLYCVANQNRTARSVGDAWRNKWVRVMIGHVMGAAVALGLAGRARKLINWPSGEVHV